MTQPILRASTLAGVAFALLLPVAGALEQPGFERYATVHALGVTHWRIELLRERWLDASPEARERVLQLFQDQPRRLARSTSPPAPEILARAWRAFDSSEPAPWPARLVDSLDLRVVPGAFEPADSGLGEPLTVHVGALYKLAVPETVDLSLIWISSQGAEKRARTEPVEPGVWRGAGFEMYVRAPLSAPGRWRLVAEVATAAGVWRGLPVEIECIADLRARGAEFGQRLGLGAGVLAPGTQTMAQELAPRLDACLNLGARASAGLSLERWLDLALDQGGASAGQPEPLGLPDFAGGRPTGWTLATPSRQPQGPILVLATDQGEHPVELLSGPLGRRWAELQRALDALLIATDLPSLAVEDGPSLPDLLDHLARARTGQGLILVLRRDAAVLLPARLRGEGLHGVERLVLCGPAAGVEPRLGLALPVLALDALAPEEQRSDGGEGAAPWSWIRRREPGFLADLAYPQAIQAWIAGLDERARERDAR